MAQTFDFDIGNVVGPPGATGNGIKSIQLLSTSGLVKTYRITMTDDTTFDFSVSDGEDGDDGNGISGASFDPQTNALTITFDDGTSFTTPSLKGAPGTPGDDGYSPAVTIATITGGHRVTITDEAHPTGQSFDVMDGANDAGSVTYDSTQTYQAGSVGAELSNQSRQLSDKPNINLGVTGASVGQIIRVLTVDANGKPQTWEAVDEDRVVTVSGTTATIVAEAGVRYVCGELAELTFTPPASGLTAIRFTSGSTPTVISLLPAADVKMPDDWTGTLEANQVYELNFEDRLGLVAQWN